MRLAWDAIADGAKAAAAGATGKRNPLGVAHEEGPAISNRAQADRLADECLCRGLGRGNRDERGRECGRSEKFTHTQPPPVTTNPRFDSWWRQKEGGATDACAQRAGARGKPGDGEQKI